MMQKFNDTLCLFHARQIAGEAVCRLQYAIQIVHIQHIDSKTEEHILAPIIILFHELFQNAHLFPLLREISLDAHLFCFRQILLLVPMGNQGIVGVNAVITLAGILRAFKAILHIPVLHAARRYGAGRIAGTVRETTATVAALFYGAQPAQGEKVVRAMKCAFHSVLLLLLMAAIRSMSPCSISCASAATILSFLSRKFGPVRFLPDTV